MENTFSFATSTDGGRTFFQAASGLSRADVEAHMDRLAAQFYGFHLLDARGSSFIATNGGARLRWRWSVES